MKECFQKNEDIQYDKLLATLGQVAEQCLPSLLHTLLLWHEAQMTNLAYLRQQQQIQQQQQINAELAANPKATVKDKKLLVQAKL